MKTTMDKKQLWLDLKAYHFEALVPAHMWDHVTAFFGGEDAATKAFAHKLSNKLNWETDFALWAIHEYKKFVYLGLISDFHVTPPQVIDQVWHEHILFTKGYRDFCDNVIHYDFDHHPELMPHEEQTKVFKSQYQDTLALYKKEFNMDAPEEIWGAAKFGRLRRYVSHKNVSRKKKRSTSTDVLVYDDDDLPLFMMFSSDSNSGSSSSSDFGGFGGGDSGGGGAGGDWSDSGDSDSGSDSGGDGGGDGGGGCSSGCGGCGGGD